MIRILLLSILLFNISFKSSAQQQKQVVKKHWAVSFSPGIVPLPGTPLSLQPAIEFYFTPRFSLINEIGLQTGKNKNLDSTALNKKYFKYKTEFRFYITESAIRPYFGLQFTTANRKFDVDKTDRYYETFQDDSVYTYNKASINSPVKTITLQFGFVSRIVKDFYFDIAMGYGIRYSNTEYTSLINLQKIRNTGFFNIKPISSYRYKGKLTKPQHTVSEIILQLHIFVPEIICMTIHKEGYKIIALCTIFFGVINILAFYLISYELPLLIWIIFALTLCFLLFIISFFRIPKRALTVREDAIVAPADGKIVAIEEVQADEYFTDRRIQVSIFMSPLNVHLNRNPVSGEIAYSKYHKGKYLVAWHPKSSVENERHSVVYRKEGKEVLVKQIAGAVAKRIVNYLHVGQKAEQSAEMGFIKFGSRVDLLLPLDARISVKIGDKPKGGVTVIATW